MDFVLLGVGSFDSHAQCRFQFAFFVSLIERLKAEARCAHSKTMFDPLLNDAEICIASEYDIAKTDNKEGKHRVSNRLTLFFMPHCCLELYNNLLWANWSYKQLQHVVVLGNSFSNYTLSSKSALELEERAFYLAKAASFVTEIPVPNDFKLMVRALFKNKGEIEEKVSLSKQFTHLRTQSLTDSLTNTFVTIFPLLVYALTH